jgi:predicted NACHT family NTPase
MANVLNRTTKQFLTSANTPDYPVEAWIIEPDMSAVVGFGSQYWVITGDVVSLMTQQQRDAVDAAALETSRDAKAARMDDLEDELRATQMATNLGLNQTNARYNALLDAIDAAATLAALKTAAAAINNLPQRTAADVKAAVRAQLGNV